MSLSSHFTTPFLTPDDWRLVITLVEHDDAPKHTPGEGIPVTLYGYLFAPPMALAGQPQPEAGPTQEPTAGQGDVTPAALQQMLRARGGCVMVASPRERDE